MNHLVILFASLAPIGLVADWPIHSDDPINAANFARIRRGMPRTEVEKILACPGEEGNGDGHSFPVSWQGRGRNVIIVHFLCGRDERASNLRIFFNPSPWQRVKEWWGGYELHPDGGRSKRLNAAA
ncbi:MAG: hypothetical protein HYR84_10600 [Planctomycetes bacterium]|nr:hypothetical protein [Planctomycetota bacterium]